MNESHVIIYTDGSCNTQSTKGAWAAIVRYKGAEVVLQGLEQNTTHNRMELTAVIKAVEYSISQFPQTELEVYSDSQYVVNLPARKEKLNAKDFITKKGNVLNNTDLLKQLIHYLENYSIRLIKVKAHQKDNGTENLNREVDIICRKLLRDEE